MSVQLELLSYFYKRSKTRVAVAIVMTQLVHTMNLMSKKHLSSMTSTKLNSKSCLKRLQSKAMGVFTLFPSKIFALLFMLVNSPIPW